MGQKKDFINNFKAAVLAQAVSFFLSAITALIVPKLLGVESYGYWQLFLLYASYIGILDFGLNEGIYLVLGGAERESLNKKELSLQFQTLLFSNMLFACILLGVSLAISDSSRAFIVLSVGVYCVVVNTTAFYYYLFQTINETRLFSYSVILDKIVFLIPLTVLIALRCESFEPYVIAYLGAKFAPLAYCLYHGKGLVSLGNFKLRDAMHSCAPYMKVGVKLLLANMTGTLAIGVTRMVTDAAWGIETFGQLSLAITMCNFFLQCVYQLSMVLFPALRRLDSSKQGDFYFASRTLLNALLPAALICYYPVAILVSFWLPSYSSAVSYFMLLIPVCIFDGRQDLLGNTFLKVMRKETFLLLINVSSVISALAFSLIGAYMIHNIYWVIALLITVLFLRCFVTELWFSYSGGYGFSWKAWSCLAVIVFFFLSNSLMPMWVSAIVSLAAYLTCIFLDRDDIKKAISFLK